MKRRERTWIGRAVVTVMAFMLLAVAGCAAPTTYTMFPAEATPAATGELQVERDDNNNMIVDLQVDHLPPPTMLAPEFSTYVVWLRPSGTEEFINKGQLEIGEERSGQTTFTTPFANFQVIVTAETEAQVLEPSQNVVLRANVDDTEDD